jgi:hypothetical protein
VLCLTYIVSIQFVAGFKRLKPEEFRNSIFHCSWDLIYSIENNVMTGTEPHQLALYLALSYETSTNPNDEHCIIGQ